MSSVDDLTTDAVPSPSRKPTAEKNKDNDDNFSDDYSDIHEEAEDIKQEFPPDGKYTQIKHDGSIPIPTQATTTVINISHANGVHVGNQTTYNINYRRSENPQRNIIQETRAIKCLKTCDRPLDRNDLLFVSEHIDETWRDIARDLAYSEGQIKQFHLDHHHLGTKEVIFQFLLDWIRMQPSEATVGRLCQMLWDREHRDVVKLWSRKKDEKCITFTK